MAVKSLFPRPGLRCYFKMHVLIVTLKGYKLVDIFTSYCHENYRPRQSMSNLFMSVSWDII